ncbi:TonB-dependent receptor [Pelomonas sp. KK5]|uniref:TonB-dependent receptor n=1 Tax=Pelomonas sp. KK5 TaxID=1855730 RepID=UPI00097C8AF9|nr:TonB-dependent receptor [Pelomonas sp. KK5]
MGKKKAVIRGLLAASTVIGSSGVALAQDAPATPAPADAQQLDKVEITGIRKSLESARNQKRNATQFVDAIVADDIGKLPDRNVAESLSRVSGIQVDRGIGEGTNVSIRGLRQNVFLFNGREIVDSTGRGGTGLDQLGTTTYGIMALVPSELISNLEVTKLAGAEQIAGGLGGIVDIRSRLPLDGPDQLVGKLGLSRDALPGKNGDELFGLISRRLDGNRLGIMASVSYDRRQLSQQGLDTFSGYRQFTDPNSSAPTQVRFGDQDVRATDIQEDRRKKGFNGAIQWRPSKAFELIADTFVSKLTSARDRYWIGFNPTSGLSNASYSDNNILLSGHATVPVQTNTEFADVKASVVSSALRAKYLVSDSLRATAELSGGRSTSSYHQRYLRMQPNSNITSSVDFDLTKGPFGAFTINGVNLSDPTQMTQTIMFDSYFNAATDNKAARVDFKKSFGDSWLDSAEFGARHSQLDSSQNPLVADIRPAGGIPASSLAAFMTTYSNPDFARGAFAGLPRSYLVPSRDAFTSCHAFTNFPAISQNAACLDASTQLTSVAATFDIKERFDEAYAKLNFDTDALGRNVAGNVGLRAIRRSMDSIGNLINTAGATSPNTATRTDNELLPSAVAKVDLTSQTVMRLGAAKVVAFPNSADLNNGLRLYAPTYANGVLVNPGTGTGGSPQLKPFKATQFDLSFEHYFGKQGLASLGLFDKDVSSYIIQKQIAETYGSDTYLVNRKVNGEGASVRGAELLLQLPFYFLPEAFQGFGTMMTYSYIDSKTPVKDAAGRDLTFPGLSKHNFNLVGYYEQGPFSLRVALNWRDPYLVSLSAANTGIYTDSYTDLSATLRYDFSPSVSLGLEANNLRNSKLRTYDGSSEGLRTNAMFGRVYKANLTLKF